MLTSLGALLGMVGFFWRLWDNRARGSFICMALGLLALAVGSWLEI